MKHNHLGTESYENRLMIVTAKATFILLNFFNCLYLRSAVHQLVIKTSTLCQIRA